MPFLPLVAIMVLAAGAVIGWALTAVFTPPRDVLSETSFTSVELVDGEVGASIGLNAVAEWPQEPAGSNQAVGTVTSVAVAAGDEVKPGSVLYAVNLRPVVIGEGATPAFRTLSLGAKGADVAQLQQLLAALAHFTAKPDGTFGLKTEQAVRAWQRGLGLEGDGVVQAGDLVFVPTLPTRVALDTAVVHRGATLTGGESVVSALAAEPTFTLPVTTAQAAMMPVGTDVEIQLDGLVWHAQVAGEKADPDKGADQVIVSLHGADGDSICGTDCARVPVTGKSLLTSKIITQQPVTGVVAPSSALLTSPGGTVSVVGEDGGSHPVTVVASARGMSVIKGVPAGLKVRVPATAAGAAVPGS
ncbi:MAG TPA: peptidoglycan-binding domain-containing protein [Terrimesophilobacter sp.]|nr:peptidoglycan-binding domain-containing protein [Terrimesophilobacter sp.]